MKGQVLKGRLICKSQERKEREKKKGGVRYVHKIRSSKNVKNSKSCAASREFGMTYIQVEAINH